MPKIKINITFKKVNLRPKKLSPSLKKILETKYLSFGSQKQGQLPHNFKRLKFIRLAKKKRRIAATITTSKIFGLKKALFRL